MAGVVKVPEKIMPKIKDKLGPNMIFCFVCTFALGLAAHMYKLTNWLPNWDSLVFRYDAQNMIHLGRWFLSAACAASSYYDLPWLCGLLTLLFHAMGAVCVCRIMRLRGKVAAGLTGVVIVTFPTVASLLMYNYIADGYSLAFLFACAAAMLLTEDRVTLPMIAASALLITLSVAIYQAYITVTVMLLLMRLIDCAFFGEDTAAELLKKSALYLVTGLFAGVLYLVLTKLSLWVSGTELSTYQGMKEAMSLSSVNIAAAFYICTHSFVNFFFDFSDGVNAFKVLNCIAFSLIAVLYAGGAVRSGMLRSPSKTFLAAVYVLLLPFGASLLAFVYPSVDYHNLMKMGYCVFYLLLVLGYERIDFLGKKVRCAVSWGILAVCAGLVYVWIVTANVSYHKLGMAYEKSYGTLIRIADRIELTDGNESCEEILIVGTLPGSEDYSAHLSPEMTGTTDGYILRADDESVGQSVVCSALNDYCGKNYRFVSGERKRELLESETVKNMKSWSDKGSVAVFDGVIIVKLGEEDAW